MCSTAESAASPMNTESGNTATPTSFKPLQAFASLALLALRSPPTVLADGCLAALLALGPDPAMLAEAGPATLLACGPDPAVLALQYGPTPGIPILPLVSRYFPPFLDADLAKFIRGTIPAYWPTISTIKESPALPSSAWSIL